jgi:orotidine-5'-phosphate decarboxylase
VRPSDPGADRIHELGTDKKLYEHMAELVRSWGEAPELRGECGLSCVGAVVAPKDADSTRALRQSMPHTPFLVPGYGAQGSTAESCRPCFRDDGSGAVVNASRSIIYAYESGDEGGPARSDWQEAITQACERFALDIAHVAGL